VGNRFKRREQLVAIEIDELRLPVNQRGGAERIAPRIGESDIVEPQPPQRIGQFLVLDEAVDGHRGLDRQPVCVRPCYALGNAAFQPL
jgi:hypothetical protein